MWQFWNGYVIIQIEGLCAARFLKRLADAGIRVFHVRKTDEAVLRLTIPARRFFDLRKLRRGLPLRIRIVGRGGLPFALRKLGRRPVLWIGTCLLFFGMLLLSTRIWVIRIGGTNRVDPEEIRSLLSERGIVPGARIEGPILITAANDLSAQIHDAAWIGLDREGVLLTVNVVEALPESTKRISTVPSDIKADKDGVVTSIRVMRGQARVKVGDRVKKGDVLISGTVIYKDNSYETSADGTVCAAVEYREETALSDRITESYETEAEAAVRILHIWDFELLRTKPPFEHYRLTDPGTVTMNGLLPIAIETRTAREIGFREKTLTEEEAEQYALQEARERAYQAIPRDAAIINTYGTIRTKNGARYAVVIVTAEEIIGKTEERPA